MNSIWFLRTHKVIAPNHHLSSPNSNWLSTLLLYKNNYFHLSYHLLCMVTYWVAFAAASLRTCTFDNRDNLSDDSRSGKSIELKAPTTSIL